MRIFIYSEFSRPYGGAETIFNLQCRMLREKGHEVFSFSVGEGYYEGANDVRLERPRNEVMRLLYKFLFHPKVYREIRRRLRAFDPHIVILHNIAIYPITALLSFRDYPVIQCIHDFSFCCPTCGAVKKDSLEVCVEGLSFRCCRHCGLNPGIFLIWWAFFRLRGFLLDRTVKKFIVPSEAAKEFLNARGYKTMCLPNPNPISARDTGQTENKEMRDKGELSAKFDYILYAGLLCENKGIRYLLEGFNKVLRFYPNLQLVIAGDGPDRKMLEYYSHQLNMDKSVKFLGWLDKGELYNCYHNAIALVIPSVGLDNYPTVALEAMTLGCPVIGSDRGGIPEILGDGRGLIFRAADPDDLAEKIICIISDTDLRKTIIRKAKMFLENSLSPTKYTEKLEAILLDCARN